MGLHYATQLYRPDDDTHYRRLLFGLERNLSLLALEHATIFLDNCMPPWKHPRVTWINLDRRATFGDFLSVANSNQDTSDHLLFANSDIIFDEEIGKLAEAMRQPEWVSCLTRREIDGSYPQGIDPLQTQDAWLLMKQPIPTLLLEQLHSIRLGIPGCEHLFAAAMVSHGFDLWNPCEDCRILHNDPRPNTHEPDGQRYWGLYAYIPPCTIQDVGNSCPEVFFAYAQAPGRYYQVAIG